MTFTGNPPQILIYRLYNEFFLQNSMKIFYCFVWQLNVSPSISSAR